MNKRALDQFHKWYYQTDVQNDTYWMGRKTVKCPLDAWVMQEIIYETRPELIVECGIFHGGSTQYYADLLDLMGSDGKVVGIDIFYDDQFDYPNHPRIEFLLGASTLDPAVVEAVAKRADGKRTMVILDDDHSCDHVLQELRLYHKFVSPGCYLVVEDTNVTGAPMSVGTHRGPGPGEAVKAWQPTKHGFEVDRSREKHLLTFHPGGYLKRVKPQ